MESSHSSIPGVPSQSASFFEERKERDEDHLQKGDELVKLDGPPGPVCEQRSAAKQRSAAQSAVLSLVPGQEGWEACNELPNLTGPHGI